MVNDQIQKTAIINRAVPGSGKTTISECLTAYLEKCGIDCRLFSTDDYFLTPEKRYNFDVDKLYENHQKNLNRFIEALQQNVPVVICDNINLAPWQTEPYTDEARKYGYKIIFIDFGLRDLSKHLEAQIVRPDKPDAHGVPEDVIRRFMKDYQDFVTLLDPRSDVDPELHKKYTWDEEKKARVETGELSKHYDLDHLIHIEQNEYHYYKENIGIKIVELITIKEMKS